MEEQEEEEMRSRGGGGVEQQLQLPLGSEEVVSSIPGSVGYTIFHVHLAYDYLGPFGVLWVHVA